MQFDNRLTDRGSTELVEHPKSNRPQQPKRRMLIASLLIISILHLIK
ncbi:hypothetical protein [Phormidium nigroviride]